MAMALNTFNFIRMFHTDRYVMGVRNICHNIEMFKNKYMGKETDTEDFVIKLTITEMK